MAARGKIYVGIGVAQSYARLLKCALNLSSAIGYKPNRRKGMKNAPKTTKSVSGLVSLISLFEVLPCLNAR
jgi:hypothetical protein